MPCFSYAVLEADDILTRFNHQERYSLISGFYDPGRNVSWYRSTCLPPDRPGDQQRIGTVGG